MHKVVGRKKGTVLLSLHAWSSSSFLPPPRLPRVRAEGYRFNSFVDSLQLYCRAKQMSLFPQQYELPPRPPAMPAYEARSPDIGPYQDLRALYDTRDWWVCSHTCIVYRSDNAHPASGDWWVC